MRAARRSRSAACSATRPSRTRRAPPLRRRAAPTRLPRCCDRRRACGARLRRRARRSRARRHGLRRAPEPGGLVRYAIAPYRLFEHPLPEEAELIRALGARIVLGRQSTAPSCARSPAANDAVVLAVGLGDDTDPHLPGRELDGVWRSLPFIEALKTGRPPAVGRQVVVVGGGNTAIDCAVEARRLGADEVTIVYRRTEAEMPAYPQEVALARDEGVDFPG